MPQLNEYLATLLRRSAGAFAGFAAAEMLEARPDAANCGSAPLSTWKAWFVDRVEELAAAVSARKPELFMGQARWAASLFAARRSQ